MHTAEPFLQRYTQNHKLGIRLIAPDFGHLSPEVLSTYGLTQRKPHYFLIFILNGKASHGIDLQDFEVKNNELLFTQPNQLHRLPESKQATAYFKMAFDENCLSLLPRQYPFLIDPFNNPKIQFASSASVRLKSVFEILLGLLSNMYTEPELILAHLNSLLTEINAAYFVNEQLPAGDKIAYYIRFKVFVENNLTALPPVSDIAREMALNTNNLYSIIKYYSGLSPKAYITNRLILEAKRRLYYAETSSVKELAYELGFNDPEYFSRLFKKETGKTVSAFIQDLSGN